VKTTTTEFVQWTSVVATMFGMHTGGEAAPAITAFSGSHAEWEEELERASKLDRTHCYSLITFAGQYPKKIQHIYRCWACGEYERPWARPRRCSCWVKYDPELREMSFSERMPDTTDHNAHTAQETP
jgi:hypothetical protein